MVSDGATDGTTAAAVASGARVIEHSRNLGYGRKSENRDFGRNS